MALSKTELVEQAKSKAETHAAASRAYMAKIENWLILGNATGLALAISGFASAKIPADLQTPVILSGWAFAIGLVAAFMFQLRMGAIEEAQQTYFVEAIKSIQLGTPMPAKAASWTPLATVWLSICQLGFAAGLLVPLIEISFIIASGNRLPVAA